MRGLLRAIAARFHVTDEQCVERARRNVATLDRWRRPLLFFYGACAILYVVSVVRAFQLLMGMMQRMGGNLPIAAVGFIFGLTFGVMFGLTAMKIVHGLLDTLLGRQCERILVRYHDAIQDLYHESLAKDESVAD